MNEALRLLNEIRVPHYNNDAHEIAFNDIDGDRQFIYNELREKYGDPVGSGKDRVVFTTNTGYVIKLGLGVEGDHANQAEVKTSAQYYNKPIHFPGEEEPMYFASCRLRSVGGFPLLVMQCVDKPRMSRRRTAGMPKWASNLDSCQVGKRGDKWMAYDYADGNHRTDSPFKW